MKYSRWIAILVVSVSFSCTKKSVSNKESSDAKTSFDLLSQVPMQVNSLADWMIVKKSLIETYREHLQTLRNINQIVQGRMKLKGIAPDSESMDLSSDSSNGFGLVSSLSLTQNMSIEQEAARLQNQGAAIANYSAMLNANASYAMQMAKAQEVYAGMSNLGWDNYLSNQRRMFENGRVAIDNDGARIGNFGKMLENHSKALDNELKQLEVVLKAMFSVAYSNYVYSYAEYSDQIQKVWRMIGRTNSQAGAAIKQLQKYQRQTAVCEARRKRVNYLKTLAANEELVREVSISAIPRIFRRFVASPEGESCLHKSLLTAQYRDSSELYQIEYQIRFDDQAIGIFCPKSEQSEFDGLSTVDYPPVAVHPESYEVNGYFQPLTYYQVFRLINDNNIDVSISYPSAYSRQQVCNPRHPEIRGFQSKSFQVEKAMADTYEVQLDAFTRDPHGYSSKYSGIPSDNAGYRLFIDRMTSIIRRAHQCTMDQRNLHDALGGDPAAPIASETAAAPAEAVAPQLGLPLEAKKPAFSDYNIFMDDSFPLMSGSIRDCMNMAEHHRYRVFAQLEAAGAILEILERATKISPPRSPHPVQFQPINVPGNRPGNDF